MSKVSTLKNSTQDGATIAPPAPDFTADRQAAPVYLEQLGEDLFAVAPGGLKNRALLAHLRQLNMSLRAMNTLSNQLLSSWQAQIDLDNAEDGERHQFNPLSPTGHEETLANLRILVSAANDSFDGLTSELRK